MKKLNRRVIIPFAVISILITSWVTNQKRQESKAKEEMKEEFQKSAMSFYEKKLIDHEAKDFITSNTFLDKVSQNWESYEKLHDAYHWSVSYLWGSSGECNPNKKMIIFSNDGFISGFLNSLYEKKHTFLKGESLGCILNHEKIKSTPGLKDKIVEILVDNISINSAKSVDYIKLLKTAGASAEVLDGIEKLNKELSHQCYDGRSEQVDTEIFNVQNEIKKANDLISENKVFWLNCYAITQYDNGDYEVALDYSGGRAILRTNETVITSKGLIGMPVSKIDRKLIKTIDGFTQAWDAYEEDRVQWENKKNAKNQLSDLKAKLSETKKSKAAISNECSRKRGIASIEKDVVCQKNIVRTYIWGAKKNYSLDENCNYHRSPASN